MTASDWRFEVAITGETRAVERKSHVRYNAENDPTYAPYCMRCTGLVRMVKVIPFFWSCRCGAQHDERTREEHLHDAKRIEHLERKLSHYLALMREVDRGYALMQWEIEKIVSFVEPDAGDYDDMFKLTPAGDDNG